jgi:predicted DNA-binding transcriptional regulator AlpA
MPIQRGEALSVPALLDVHDLSRILGIPEPTLYGWRTHGKGPEGIRLGRHLRYRPQDVQAWLDAQARGGDRHGK